MYLDNKTEYKKHIETLQHRNNVSLVNGEIIKNGSKFECVTFKSTLSQYSVDQHLKTKLHLDNVRGKDKEITADDNNKIARKDNNKTEGNCNICKTRYNNKNEHNEPDEHKKKLNRKNFLIRSGEIKLMSWD